ncbi:hypothetical protein D3C71_2111790 [compost metagenome]
MSQNIAERKSYDPIRDQRYHEGDVHVLIASKRPLNGSGHGIGELKEDGIE